MKNSSHHIPKFLTFFFLVTIAVNCFSQTKTITIDQAHFNFHTMSGGYAAFAELLRQNGYSVTANTELFTSKRFESANVLVIANPFPNQRDTLTRQAQSAREPFRWSAVAARSAFSTEEIEVLRNWVFNGGALLLILDHAPHGETGGQLAAAFGIETRNVETTDSTNTDNTVKSPTLLFTKSKGLIGKHEILKGVDSVVTYLGESLSTPKNSTALLLLPKTTLDRDWLPATREYRNRSAEGRVQAVAIEYGKGRVVVLGEAGMLTTTPGNNTNSNGTDGIARSDRGNRQLALNIMEWLSSLK
jgi:hypothetical protein